MPLVASLRCRYFYRKQREECKVFTNRGETRSRNLHQKLAPNETQLLYSVNVSCTKKFHTQIIFCTLFCLSLACRDLVSSYCTLCIGQQLALYLAFLSCSLCIVKLHVVRFTFEQIQKEGRKERKKSNPTILILSRVSLPVSGANFVNVCHPI